MKAGEILNTKIYFLFESSNFFTDFWAILVFELTTL